MGRSGSVLRRFLITALVGVLFSSPADAEAGDLWCEMKWQHYGLFCNDGSLIEICEGFDGCTAQCPNGDPVSVTC